MNLTIGIVMLVIGLGMIFLGRPRKGEHIPAIPCINCHVRALSRLHPCISRNGLPDYRDQPLMMIIPALTRR